MPALPPRGQTVPQAIPAPAGIKPLSEFRLRALAMAPKLDLAGRSIDRCSAADPVVIPRLDEWADPENLALGPGWAPVHQLLANGSRQMLKPHIRCKCGCWSGIGLHRVFADGRVMASFFDATAEQLAAMGEARRHIRGFTY